jgi:hypothetical protein
MFSSIFIFQHGTLWPGLAGPQEPIFSTCHMYIVHTCHNYTRQDVHMISVENRLMWSGQARQQGAMLKNENGRRHLKNSLQKSSSPTSKINILQTCKVW